MTNLVSRRLILTGFAAAVANPQSRPPLRPGSGPGGLKLGVATYSVRRFHRVQAIRMIQRLRTSYVSVKDVHLPYQSTPAELSAGSQEFRDAGLEILSGGVIPLKDPQTLRSMFEYAAACGMPMIVGAPLPANLGAIEKLVAEFDIKLAIHNHGPEAKQFPSPQSILTAIRDMDPRIGLCVDVGHTARTSEDVLESLEAAGPRLFEIHVKDYKDRRSKSFVEVGDGLLPVVEMFKLLKQMGYQHGVMLEYSISENDPLPGMRQSFAYMRGVLDGLAG